MKQKVVIGGAIVLLIAVLGIMSYDLFFETKNDHGNPFEYSLDKLKQVDTNLLCYNELMQINTYENISAITVDIEDNIYVSTDDKLIKYNSKGDSLSSFIVGNKANCIASAKEGKLYLGFKNHIETWSNDGSLIKRWPLIDSASYITSIAVNEPSIFIADAGKKVVHHFNIDGKLIKQIGKKDKEKGIPGLFIPSPYFDVLIGRDDELWVINTGRHSFEAYDKSGNLSSSWNRTSMSVDGFSGCCNPTHVAILQDGSFVTSEKGLERVKIHHANGDLKCIVAAPDQFIEGTTGLDLAVDSKDRILILDPEKRAVRIFKINE